MSIEQQNIQTAPVVREYAIGGTTYIVKATVKENATEDAVSKVRRLIRNEIKRQNEKKDP